MSALTKLFVVLLVVCSLLLTAATVVFINKVEDWQEVAKRKDEAVGLAQNQLQTRENELAAERNKSTSLSQALNDAVTAGAKEVQAKDEKIRGLEGQLATATTEKQVAAAQITQLGSTLDAANARITALTTENKSVIGEMDTLRVKNAELAGMVTDQIKRIDALAREFKFSNEQLAQWQAKATKLQQMLDDAGVKQAPAPKRVQSLPDVKGVVRSVVAENGQNFAKISLGSVDKIEAGMELQVIDQVNSKWMGKIIIERVDATDAFGRIEGPGAADVKPEHWVVSKL